MKRTLRPYLWLALAGMPIVGNAAADDRLYVYTKAGTVDVFAQSIVESREQTATQLIVTLKNGGPTQTYALADIDSVSTNAPSRALPKFTSFKFNNKYNDNVYTDVVATIHETDSISASIGCIGKSLTPSFQLDNVSGKAYIGSELQKSKESRHRFASDVVYTLGYEGWREMQQIKTKDEEIIPAQGVQYTASAIALTESMLSTNHPSDNADEGVANLIDGNTSTIFHSWWSQQQTPSSDPVYIQADLNQAVRVLQVSYTTRTDNSQKCPQTIEVQVSSDGVNWTTKATLENLPQGSGKVYTSDFINLGGSYSHIRVVQTATYYRKNYFCLAELSLASGTAIPGSGTSDTVIPAEYEWGFQPYGRRVPVHINWLSDQAGTVPRIDINTVSGQCPEDLPNNTGRTTYLQAYATIDGAGIFPSMQDSVLVRGRGNSSWYGETKKPYRLKFASAKKPFGLTKGKSWVLLADAITGSMMTNALAMKAANMMGAVGANDVIPVELYMNGKYKGSYCFTQQVGFSNNSIDLPDESNAVMYELDTYTDEPIYVEPSYKVCTKIKEPDLEEMAETDPAGAKEKQAELENYFAEFTSTLKNGTDEYADLIDVDAFARYISVNEFVLNLELKHSKSTFAYNADLTNLAERLTFGPVWDFDWGFGYEEDNAYCQSSATVDYATELGYSSSTTGAFLFRDMLRNSDAVKRARYAVWTDFMKNHKQEFLEFIDDYYEFARTSFEHNATVWGDGRGYATISQQMKQWLSTRADAVYAQQTVYDLSVPLAPKVGDVNGDGYVTTADVSSVINYLLGKPVDPFDMQQADANDDGVITLADVVRIVALSMQKQ